MKTNPATIQTIIIIAKALGELNDKAVFVGGATIPFYLPEIYQTLVRPTEDVDVVMEIVGKSSNYANEELLRQKGFLHDSSKGAPLCRWLYRNLKVDIMSSNISALDFTNIWYQEGIENSIEIMKTPVSVKIFTAPYFIATKLEAFKSRGNLDYVASADMEDIISILEVSTQEIFEDMLPLATVKLREYIIAEFSFLLKKNEFQDALQGAILNRVNSDESVKIINNRIKKLIGTNL